MQYQQRAYTSEVEEPTRVVQNSTIHRRGLRGHLYFPAPPQHHLSTDYHVSSLASQSRSATPASRRSMVMSMDKRHLSSSAHRRAFKIRSTASPFTHLCRVNGQDLPHTTNFRAALVDRHVESGALEMNCGGYTAHTSAYDCLLSS
jgi:hypothetical protein